MPEGLRAVCRQAHFQDIDAIQAAVHAESTPVFSEAFGAASTRSIFDVASVTKLAATTMVASVLHSRGSFSLSDSIATFLPDPRESHGGIQVHHLLAHSSGLPACQPFHPKKDDPSLLGNTREARAVPQMQLNNITRAVLDAHQAVLQAVSTPIKDLQKDWPQAAQRTFPPPKITIV